VLNDDIKPVGADNTDDDDIPVNSAIPQPIVEIADASNEVVFSANSSTA